MSINKTQAERLIFLINLQAKNFGEMERNMIAIARTLECLLDIDSNETIAAKPANTYLSHGNELTNITGQSTANIALKTNTEALAGISGITLSVHPRNETEELLERLQEDHGV